MTKQEVAQALSVIRLTYPSSSRLSEAEGRLQVGLWHSIFRDRDGAEVLRALRDYIAAPGNRFAPTPGELVALMEPEEAGMDKYEAWDLVEATLRSKAFAWDPAAAFAELPAPVRAACGSVREMVAWSRSEERGLAFIRREFMDRYEAVEKRAERGRLQIGEPGPAALPGRPPRHTSERILEMAAGHEEEIGELLARLSENA